ncbi:MAG TPA: glycine betaine ABC transporter substrate-binding protein [Solirubrobacterales bacterium]|nr:glycine betaine ABC transporter substrate-binding protein [Solirubrobacterales bacterium]
MLTNPRTSTLLAAIVLAGALAACGSGSAGNTGGTDLSANRIERNPNNDRIEITVGSKNFTEQYVLAEIYANALEAAGYDVKTDLNLGSEQIALAALRQGTIDAYPEYTSTALTSFFELPPEAIPADAQQAFEESRDDFGRLGLVALPPTPFSSGNAVGLLTERADELGVTRISDLEGVSQDLTLYGAPECRQRIDCLAGLERYYGLEFESFTPVEIERRYEVLAKGQADLSILFTTDPQLFVSDEYVILDDDKGVLPAGNVLFVARRQTVDEAGPDFAETVERVQENLTLEVMQELNARVDVDGEEPEEAARRYLEDFGYIE